MANPTKPTLAELFPALKPFAAEADQFLVHARSLTLREQLLACLIGAIEPMKILSPTGLKKEGLPRGMFILVINKSGHPSDFPKSLGKTLGLSFFYDPMTQPISCKIPLESDEDGYGSLVEEFCQAFSHRWLAQNDRKSIQQACLNQRKDIKKRSYLEQ